MAGLVPFHTDGMACTHMAWPVLRWHGLYTAAANCLQATPLCSEHRPSVCRPTGAVKVSFDSHRELWLSFILALKTLLGNTFPFALSAER